MAGLTCSVCAHPQRDMIDGLLAAGTLSRRAIAVQFGLVHTSIERHRLNHLTKRIVKAAERKKIKADDVFIDGLKSTIQRMSQGVDLGIAAIEEFQVEPEMAFRMAPAYAAQQIRALELFGRATGRLSDAQTTAQATHIVILGGQVNIDQRETVTPVTDRVTAEACQQLDDGHTIDIKALGNS